MSGSNPSIVITSTVSSADLCYLTYIMSPQRGIFPLGRLLRIRTSGWSRRRRGASVGANVIGNRAAGRQLRRGPICAPARSRQT